MCVQHLNFSSSRPLIQLLKLMILDSWVGVFYFCLFFALFISFLDVFFWGWSFLSSSAHFILTNTIFCISEKKIRNINRVKLFFYYNGDFDDEGGELKNLTAHAHIWLIIRRGWSMNHSASRLDEIVDGEDVMCWVPIVWKRNFRLGVYQEINYVACS